MTDQPTAGHHPTLTPARHITTADVWEWLKGARCARQFAADHQATARVFAGLHASAEASVTRVIEAVEAGAPSGTAIPGEWERGWDAAMDAVRQALALDAEEQAAPINWQAIARQREVELKTVGEAKHGAEQERDGAYRERAHLVALLAAMTDGAVITYAPDIEEPGWQIVYLPLGDRQASWHISPRDADLFTHVERVEYHDPRGHWDGHTTEEKYEGIAAWAAELAQRCGPACAEMHTETGRCEIARGR